MSNVFLVILALLVEQYPTPDSCWTVLDKDLVEWEKSSRVEMEWCMLRYRYHYNARKGIIHCVPDKGCRTGSLADELRWRFEQERKKQRAYHECLMAEDEINYGSSGSEPHRQQEVDLDCWGHGWRLFYQEDSNYGL